MQNYEPTVGAQSYRMTITPNGQLRQGWPNADGSLPTPGRNIETEEQAGRIKTHMNAIAKSNTNLNTVLTCTHIDGRDEQEFIKAAESHGWKIVKITRDPKIAGECGGYIKRVDEIHMLVTPKPELQFFNESGRRILDWWGRKI